MAVPLINGQAYDYTQIVVLVLGVPLPSITNINYIEEQEKVMNPGLGNRAVSLGRGPILASGSFDISMNDVEALRDAAPNGSLVQIPAFDIICVFGILKRPLTHVLKNVEFTDDGVEAAQGDTDVKRTFNIVMFSCKI